MSRIYLQHPLLKNPSKWLRGVNKRHDSKLYLREYYDTNNMDDNPFLKILSDTRLDVSRNRFPIGGMVQIVVSKLPDKKFYGLMPVVKKPTEGQNPASYVINSKGYIQFLSRKRFFPVPSKYKHKSPSAISLIKISSDFPSDIGTLYRQRIKMLLKEITFGDCEESQDKNGVLLKVSETERVFWNKDSLPVIYTAIIEKDVFLSYRRHPELVSLLLKLATFESV